MPCLVSKDFHLIEVLCRAGLKQDWYSPERLLVTVVYIQWQIHSYRFCEIINFSHHRFDLVAMSVSEWMYQLHSNSSQCNRNGMMPLYVYIYIYIYTCFIWFHNTTRCFRSHIHVSSLVSLTFKQHT